MGLQCLLHSTASHPGLCSTHSSLMVFSLFRHDAGRPWYSAGLHVHSTSWITQVANSGGVHVRPSLLACRLHQLWGYGCLYLGFKGWCHMESQTWNSSPKGSKGPCTEPLLSHAAEPGGQNIKNRGLVMSLVISWSLPCSWNLIQFLSPFFFPRFPFCNGYIYFVSVPSLYLEEHDMFGFTN